MISQYKKLAATKRDVNTRRINRINFERKLRLASFVSVPRLVRSK